MKTKTALLAAILAVIVLSGVLAYGFEQIKSQNELASILLNQSDSLNAANNLARSTRADRDKAAGNLAVLDQVVLNQSEIVPFIELIESTAHQMGLKVKIASVNADPAPKVATTTSSATVYVPPQAIHIDFGTDGSWSANFGFLHALENLPQKISLDSVDLNFAPGTQSQGTTTPSGSNWHANFTLTTYVFQN